MDIEKIRLVGKLCFVVVALIQLAIEWNIVLDEYVVSFEVLAGHGLRCYLLLGFDLPL